MSDANDPHHMAVSECVTMAQILTDTARGIKYVASDARIAKWFIVDVRSLTQHLINIISNDAHSQ
jgi:hypothetical protein